MVKNPLSRECSQLCFVVYTPSLTSSKAVEHKGGVGVANELFELALESFVVGFVLSSFSNTRC